MRIFWLASAALIVSTGVAFAQTSMSAPAPTGAPNAPVETSPGMSPGNTAPNSQAGGMASGMAGGMSGAAQMHAGMAGTQADAGAVKDLEMAKAALGKHDKAKAEENLSHAQTMLLTRSVPQSPGMAMQTDHSPAYMSVTKARAALQASHFIRSKTDTDMAIHQLQEGRSEGMNNPAAGGVGGTTGTSPVTTQ